MWPSVSGPEEGKSGKDTPPGGCVSLTGILKNMRQPSSTPSSRRDKQNTSLRVQSNSNPHAPPHSEQCNVCFQTPGPPAIFCPHACLTFRLSTLVQDSCCLCVFCGVCVCDAAGSEASDQWGRGQRANTHTKKGPPTKPFLSIEWLYHS